MARKKKRIRISVAEVEAAHQNLLEQERERMSHPRPVESHLPVPPKSRRIDIGAHEPRPVKRVTPNK